MAKLEGLPAAYKKMLIDNDPAVRIKAVQMLAKLGGYESLTLLGNLVDDPDPLVRRELALVLSEIGVGRVVDPLLKLVGDGNEVVQEAALDALIEFDDPRIMMLLLKELSSLRDGFRLKVQKNLETKLAARKTQAQDSITPLAAEIDRDLKDSSLEIRVKAVKMIESIALSDRNKAEELLSLAMSDSEARVRAEVVRVIGAAGSQDLLRNLIGVLNDPDERVRADAVETLSQARNSWAADVFLPLLRDPDNRVRANAALSMWQLGHPDIMKTLIEMLSDEDESMRSSAVWVLGEMGSLNALKAIERILEIDKNEGVRANARKSIDKIMRNNNKS